MRTEITCLCCEGQDVKDDHVCAVGSFRGKVLTPLCLHGHRDFCRMCRKLLNRNFEGQFRLLPKPRIRVEGQE